VSALPRDLCPVCGRSVAVRRNGTVREHRRSVWPRRAATVPLCAGSGLKPKPQPLRDDQLEISGL